MIWSSRLAPCNAAGPTWTASRMPLQACRLLGGAHRRGPTGGSAKGTPLKAFRPALLRPCSLPQGASATTGVTRSGIVISRPVAREGSDGQDTDRKLSKVHRLIRSRPTPFHRSLGTCGPVFAFANGPTRSADVL